MLVKLLFVHEADSGVDCLILGISFHGSPHELVNFSPTKAVDLLNRTHPWCAGLAQRDFEFLGIFNVAFSGVPIGRGFTLIGRLFEGTCASRPSMVRKPFRLVRDVEYMGAFGSCLELRYYLPAWPRDGKPCVMHCTVHGPIEASGWTREKLQRALERPHPSTFLPFPASAASAILLPRIHVHEVIPMNSSVPPEVVYWGYEHYDCRSMVEEMVLDSDEILDAAAYCQSEAMRPVS